ncbi:chemotaxis protein CheW [Pseudomonas typographi]|uniref:Purine-binding chemotaxis protein CheW n=1 Tax=Pseudomonas typographi TaxID=2715964 RepID=A0ABR7YZG7_9PSED|nr:chemotaxis protein CheW [Pseudomonas typographi]MBD1549925.1 purine-binding chemotaxis protein CheW [Pseudomonas typographi]MBD1585306.1 purine-binding chemotaxis protein CheW [Pseudomonas typographi]MBD1598580.1 purine-binding chemotaxis protein CheW [Pseudomonas typographi]
MNPTSTAFELLLDIDRRCRAQASALPSQDARLQSWSGIGFRLASHWFVAPMAEVVEVLPEPRLAQVPGVHHWVRGVANLRGRLLPVMDLCGFFGQERSSVRKQRRVLVIDHEELFTGLLVDEVPGLQHFPLLRLDPGRPPGLPENLQPFVQGHFQRERDWAVFSPLALTTIAEFMNVAL